MCIMHIHGLNLTAEGDCSSKIPDHSVPMEEGIEVYLIVYDPKTLCRGLLLVINGPGFKT